MGVFYNPAGGLTSGRLPCSVAGGGLGDTGIAWGSSRMSVTTAAGLSTVGGSLLSLIGSYGGGLALVDTGLYSGMFSGASGASLNFYAGKSSGAAVPSAAEMTLVGGNVLVGTAINSANGRIQLANHAGMSGGIAFGSSATGSISIWQRSLSELVTGAWFQAANLAVGDPGTAGIAISDASPSSSPVDSRISFYDFKRSTVPMLYCPRGSGWAMPTGTATRATFNTATVTLPQLAERVYAIISDLHTAGNCHGLFTT